MQEHCLEVGFFDLHAVHRDSGVVRRLQYCWKDASAVVGNEVHAVIRSGGADYPRNCSTRGGQFLEISRGGKVDVVPLPEPATSSLRVPSAMSRP